MYEISEENIFLKNQKHLGSSLSCFIPVFTLLHYAFTLAENVPRIASYTQLSRNKNIKKAGTVRVIMSTPQGERI